MIVDHQCHLVPGSRSSLGGPVILNVTGSACKYKMEIITIVVLIVNIIHILLPPPFSLLYLPLSHPFFPPHPNPHFAQPELFSPRPAPDYGPRTQIGQSPAHDEDEHEDDDDDGGLLISGQP